MRLVRKAFKLASAGILLGTAALGLIAGLGGRARAADEAAKAAYAGAEQNCRMCHSDIYNGWLKTKHARAFRLLENVGKSKDPACLPCHTTGYGAGGYEDETKTPNLKGVQCEACHGPGSQHNGVKEKIQGSPAAKVCAKCHLNLGLHG